MSRKKLLRLSLAQNVEVEKTYIDGLLLWKYRLFPEGQRHFVSGRQGGVSLPPLDSLNLSYSAGDEVESVEGNRKRLAIAMEVKPENLLFVSQCHSATVVVIKDRDAFIKGQEGDAIVTNVPGVCVCVMAADCVPVLAYDPIRKVGAAIHAGWRGTASGIVLKTIGIMVDSFGSDTKDIIVGIGPSISQSKYEVGEDVYLSFKRSRPNEADLIFKYDSSKKKYFPDLWLANKLQALEMGVANSNIEVAEICTFSEQEYFFSARYSKNNTGRFASGIVIG